MHGTMSLKLCMFDRPIFTPTQISSMYRNPVVQFFKAVLFHPRSDDCGLHLKEEN